MPQGLCDGYDDNATSSGADCTALTLRIKNPDDAALVVDFFHDLIVGGLAEIPGAILEHHFQKIALPVVPDRQAPDAHTTSASTIAALSIAYRLNHDIRTGDSLLDLVVQPRHFGMLKDEANALVWQGNGQSFGGHRTHLPYTPLPGMAADIPTQSPADFSRRSSERCSGKSQTAAARRAGQGRDVHTMER